MNSQHFLPQLEAGVVQHILHEVGFGVLALIAEIDADAIHIGHRRVEATTAMGSQYQPGSPCMIARARVEGTPRRTRFASFSSPLRSTLART